MAWAGWKDRAECGGGLEVVAVGVNNEAFLSTCLQRLTLSLGGAARRWLINGD